MNGKHGTINLQAQAGWQGDSGATSLAAALGLNLRLPADNGIMDITATPGLSADLQTSYFLDSATADGFIGLIVEQFTLGGEFVQTVVDQQISLSSLGGATSGLPLAASTPVDGDHYYTTAVWVGINVYGDGSGIISWSMAAAQASVIVPHISIYYYS